jgi:hypothetical protein
MDCFASLAMALICPSCQTAAIDLFAKSLAGPPYPAPERGALRDRHERWVRDAMDAVTRKTKRVEADGEVVWF